MKFAIVFDGKEYDIEPCSEGADPRHQIEKKYPPSAGWKILDTADTMDQATFKIEEHRARVKAEAL
jgi:hypothetical protein